MRIHLPLRSAPVRFWRLLQLSMLAAYHDNCFGIAKGAAYSGLLAFFPVLTTLAALLVQANAAQVARTIAAFLYEVVPPGAEDLVQRLFVVQGAKPALLLVSAAVVAAWAASGRGFVKDRAMFPWCRCGAPRP